MSALLVLVREPGTPSLQQVMLQLAQKEIRNTSVLQDLGQQMVPWQAECLAGRMSQRLAQAHRILHGLSTA